MTDYDYDDDLGDEPGGPGLTIEALLGGETVTVAGDTPLREVAKALDEAQVGLVVVGTATKVEAVVSERDIVRAVAAGTDLDGTTAREAGASKLRWATVDSTVSEVIDEMMTSYLRHVLVANGDGSLAGVLSMRDLLATFTG